MLKRVAGTLRFTLVVPRVPLRAILTHDGGRDVDVVATVFRTPVMDRDPPAWRFSI